MYSSHKSYPSETLVDSEMVVAYKHGLKDLNSPP